MVINIGMIDRVARIIVGLTLIGAATGACGHQYTSVRDVSARFRC